MKNGAALSILLLVLSACSSTGPMTSSSNAPPLEIHLAQLNTVPDLFYFAGPVNVQYALQIVNPTNETYKLKRISLDTIGPGAYTLRTGDTPISYTVPPGTTTLQLSAWAQAAGGFIRSTEPVTIRGIAYFDGPNGPFVKMFTEIVRPQ
jgi:hypothetical protein